MGTHRETWGHMGGCGDIWRGLGTCKGPRREAEMWGGAMGPYGEDMGTHRMTWGHMGGCGDIWGPWGHREGSGDLEGHMGGYGRAWGPIE